MQRIGEALQRSQRGGGKPSNYKTTSRWLYLLGQHQVMKQFCNSQPAALKAKGKYNFVASRFF
jgi:hypothetical protein